MPARCAWRLVLGLLVIWSTVRGAAHLFAADDQPYLTPFPEKVASARPIAEAESTLGQSSESEVLGLLEASYETVAYEDDSIGDYESDCADCDSAGYYGGGHYDRSPQPWMKVDYLLWWTNGMRLPPLATTSPNGTTRAEAGVLGFPDTTALFGDGRVNTGGRSSARITLGYWVDSCKDLAMEGDYFDIGGETAGFAATSNGDPIIARPFFDLFVTGGQWSELIGYPGLRSGTLTIRASDYFGSAGARMRYNLAYREACSRCSCYQCSDYGSCGSEDCSGHYGYGGGSRRSFRLDFIAGYRHYRLNDSVNFQERVTNIDSGDPNFGTVLSLSEGFSTRNEFNGAELGLVAQAYRGRLSFEFLAKMALGNNHRSVTINGTSLITSGATTTARVGGLLTQQSNIGRFVDNDFVVIPQFGVEMRYQLTHGLKAYLGYNILYWAHVVRSGDQIDLAVNLSQQMGSLIGDARPAFPSRRTDFWAQGMNMGFELSF